MIINNLITELVKNMNNDNIPRKIDLILDGGAFNGSFQLGGLMYLKEMERNGMIQVDKISGVSVGALLGIAYILDKLDVVSTYFDMLINSYKKQCSLKDVYSVIESFVKNEMNKDDYLKLNGRLYITYYNNKTKTQILKRRYKNNNDVSEIMHKTSFIPYLMNSSSYKDKFVDGAFPHIFKCSKTKKTLFMYLLSNSKLSYMLKIKNEENLYGRMIEGIFDVNKFFNKNERTDMCSYVDDWTVIDFGLLRMREIVWIIILFLLDIGKYINLKLPNFVVDSIYFTKITHIFQKYYIDIVSHILT